jgi:predicted DsbA family dithiol-disulfide isomerase
VNVEIWSDIACPWCFVGKRRFEAALAQFEHAEDVTVTWRSFELDPSAPASLPGDRSEHLARKIGVSVEQARGMEAQMTEMAKGDGVEFRFDRAHLPNTFDGHRLVHLAAQHGVQDAMKDRLFRANFTDGELVSDHDTLVRLGVEVGLPEEEVREALAGDAYGAEVRDDERTAQGLGIRGVPFFVVDRALGASGAQSPDVLLGLLREGWQRQPPAITVVADGDACGIDGC